MKHSLVILFLLITSAIFAQNKSSLSSDRPGQALSPNLVGNAVFQIQPGVDFLNSSDVFLLNSYFRYGISNSMELNSGIAYTAQNGNNKLSAFSLGSRIRLNKVESQFTSALQLSLNLPVDNLEFGSQAIYILSANFTEKLSWTANLGANFDENFDAIGLYVFNITYAYNENFGIFVEPFGQFDNALSLSFDTGFYYLVHNNFQLDFQIGDNEGLFLGAGFTYRFLPKK